MAKKIKMTEVVRSLKKNQPFKRDLFKRVQREFEKKKKLLIESFNSHPVTQEIEGGANAGNESGTLSGYGNLYSFIGFMAGSTPTNKLRKLLLKRTRLKRKANKITTQGKKMKVEYIIDAPTEGEITTVTPMPWESGRSWAYGVERGISGFGFYIYKKWKTSRSGGAIQAQQKQRGGTYKRRGYLSEIWLEFAKRLR